MPKLLSLLARMLFIFFVEDIAKELYNTFFKDIVKNIYNIFLKPAVDYIFKKVATFYNYCYELVSSALSCFFNFCTNGFKTNHATTKPFDLHSENSTEMHAKASTHESSARSPNNRATQVDPVLSQFLRPTGTTEPTPIVKINDINQSSLFGARYLNFGKTNKTTII